MEALAGGGAAPTVRNMTEADKAEVWRRYGDGASAAMIARTLGFAASSVAEFIRNAGGIRPKPRCPSPGRLSLDEHEEISRGLPPLDHVSEHCVGDSADGLVRYSCAVHFRRVRA